MNKNRIKIYLLIFFGINLYNNLYNGIFIKKNISFKFSRLTTPEKQKKIFIEETEENRKKNLQLKVNKLVEFTGILKNLSLAKTSQIIPYYLFSNNFMKMVAYKTVLSKEKINFIEEAKKSIFNFKNTLSDLNKKAEKEIGFNIFKIIKESTQFSSLENYSSRLVKFFPMFFLLNDFIELDKETLKKEEIAEELNGNFNKSSIYSSSSTRIDMFASQLSIDKEVGKDCEFVGNNLKNEKLPNDFESHLILNIS